MKIRFTLNQTGLSLEHHKEGSWRLAGFFAPEVVEYHGGIQNLKSKVLMQITQRYELVLPGEYKDEPGVTVQCV